MADEQGLNGKARQRRATARAAAGFAAAVVLAAAAVSASAQDSRDVQALTQKIERLQGELNDLQRRVYGGERQAQDDGGSGQTAKDNAGSGNAGSGVADGMTQAAARRLRQRMESLEGDIRRITGKLQETRNELQKTAKRVDKLVTDVDYRLRELEDFRKKAAAQIEGLTDGTDGKAAEGGTQDGTTDGNGRSGSTQTAEADGGDDGRSVSDDGEDGTGEAASDGNGPADGSADGNGAQGSDGSGTIGTVSQAAVDQLRQEAEQSAAAKTETGDGAGTSSNGAGSGAGDAGSANGDDAGETRTASKPSGAGVLPDAPPREQYDHAFKLLRDRNYADAETAMRAFIEAHPEHKLAGNAKYWLGETFYVRGKYNQAAVAFAEGFRTYPDSRKAPDNLLKLGITLAKIDKVDKACRLFSELQNRFPDAAQNIRHRAQREKKRLECGSES